MSHDKKRKAILDLAEGKITADELRWQASTSVYLWTRLDDGKVAQGIVTNEDELNRARVLTPVKHDLFCRKVKGIHLVLSFPPDPEPVPDQPPAPSPMEAEVKPVALIGEEAEPQLAQVTTELAKETVTKEQITFLPSKPISQMTMEEIREQIFGR